MSGPFFSVAIPTKDRPAAAARALRSVLGQTFEDFEVIVCDNSDETAAAQTAAVVEAAGDPRVRYVRTNGRLSMPDNWEHAISGARGAYVGILTDRSVFRRDAMQVVCDEIAATGAPLVNWFNDLYGRRAAGTDYKRRSCTLKRYRHPSSAILDYFVHGDPRFSTKIVPKLMTSFCSAKILDEIRRGPVGRCCAPVAPDFTSGFLMLAHCDWVLTIDEALYVSVGSGNGADFRRGGELADRFRRDLGMEPHEMVDRMPSSACFSHALVLNDLMRVRDAIPDRLPDLEVDHVQYYLGCLNDYTKATRSGADREADMAILLAALEREPPRVRNRVKRTKLHAVATSQREMKERVKARIVALTGDPREALPSYETVEEAMAWDASAPREPAPSSFLDLTRTADKLVRRRRRAATATATAAAIARGAINLARAPREARPPRARR